MTVRPYEEAQRPAEPKAEAKKAPAKKKEESDDMSVTTLVIMPAGKGTYGSKVGRPKKSGTAAKLKAKNPKMPAKVAKAIAKNMKKK